MNRFKKFIVGAAASALLLSHMVTPALAVDPWNVTGSYDVAFMLTGDPTVYTHDANLSQTGSTVTGDGGYPAGGPYTYHWNVTSGSVSGNTINLSVLYDLGATGTVMNMTGTIAPDGSMSGAWSDNLNDGTRTGTWNTTSGVAFQSPAECSDITFSGSPIMGTSGSDVINGTGGNDLIYALGGSDKVDGKGGDDCIVGGDGSDRLIGGSGDDAILGGDGSESIDGDGGMDKLYGEDGSDSLRGGTNDDQLWGGNNSDSLHGDGGEDTLMGGDGSDSLKGGSGNDNLTGEAGMDSANGGNNTDTCDAEAENSCEI